MTLMMMMMVMQTMLAFDLISLLLWGVYHEALVFLLATPSVI